MDRYLVTPGPVPVPQGGQEAGVRQPVSHREPAFSVLLARVVNRLRDLLDTSGPVVVLPSSGTGALEALVQNLIAPGERVLSVSCGAFGERFREIARRRGAEVVPLDIPWGRAVSPEEVRSALRNSGGVAAVLLTHNETSTGVVNPVEAIASVLPGKKPLLLVDSVSGLGAMPCFPERWGVDGLASASQKGLLAPPGLGIAWLSPRGWEKASAASQGGLYFDLPSYRERMEGGRPQTPCTPAVTLLNVLDATLHLMVSVGYGNWFAEKRRFAAVLCGLAESMGIPPLVETPDHRSPGVTALSVPGAGGCLQEQLRALGMETAGGQGPLKGEIVRIASYAQVGWMDLSLIAGTLFAAARECGMSVTAPDIEGAWEQWKEGRHVEDTDHRRH
ncbi:MAG: alanine--glyoxylate aminotransferase family protein [Synergistales bacterium]|nr:alanine--glyoxylate aminotransferase family protein [Synergistales bacterium]